MADGKVAMNAQAFAEIQDEYKKTLESLGEDENLSNFKDEFQKVFDALVASHSNEQRLMDKCLELNGALNDAATTVDSVAGGAAQGDVKELKTQIENAQDAISDYQAREIQLKDQIDDYKMKIEEMSEQLGEGGGKPGMGGGQSGEDVSELIRKEKQLRSEHDGLVEERDQLRVQVEEARQLQFETEKQRDDGQGEIEGLNEQLKLKNTEYDRELRKKKQLEREKTVIKHELDQVQTQINQRQARLQDMQTELEETRSDVNKKKLDIERLEQEQAELTEENRRLERTKDQSDAEVDRAKEDTQLLKREMKARDQTLAHVKKEAADLTKFNEKLKKQLKASEDNRIEVESKRNELKTECSRLERELDTLKKQVESDRKHLEDLARHRDILTKKTMTAGNETEVQKQMVRSQEGRLKHLEQEIAGFKIEAQKQRKLIFSLEKERDRFINEASVSSQNCMQALEKNKVLDNQISDYKKKIKEAELRLKQQQGLYEAVRSDRNLYSKNFLEAQDEITEKKRKLKIMNHQIEQLKEEISTKEGQLSKKHADLEEVAQEKIKLQSNLNALTLQRKKHDKIVKDLKKQQVNLERMLHDVTAELDRKKKQFEEVVNERDILGTQLIRRNDELRLVYEKIRIQQSTLGKGETQYRQRLDDIRLLKMEIKRLRREKTILNKTVSNVEQLKREVHHAQRSLLRERMRCRALEEELETPMNVHRWRKLKGSDPSTYEKIQKIQTLQKRLIQKTEEVVEKELQIQESEKEYVELKQLLARQPGPEVQTQIQIYQQTLKDKQRQLKSMASELNMYKSQSSEYQYEIERLARELQETKKRYFEHKKKEFQTRERDRALKPSQEAMATAPRFTGGGFSLASPPKRTTEQIA